MLCTNLFKFLFTEHVSFAKIIHPPDRCGISRSLLKLIWDWFPVHRLAWGPRTGQLKEKIKMDKKNTETRQKYGFFFATLPRRPASRSRLFTVHVEPGVLRVLFNEAASWGLVRCLFLKLDTNVLVLLLSCAPGPPTPLSILVRASLRSSVKGVVHSVVRELQFLGNFSHGIAFISQNKNTLMSFRRNWSEIDQKNWSFSNDQLVF